MIKFYTSKFLVKNKQIFIPLIFDYGIYPAIMQCENIIHKQFIDPSTGLKFVRKENNYIIIIENITHKTPCFVNTYVCHL